MGAKAGSPVLLTVVPWGGNVGGTDLDAEVTLFAVPNYAAHSVVILSVTYCNHTVATTLTCDLEWVDDSDGDAVASLISAVNLVGTARVSQTIWRGYQVLDAGDSLNIAATVTTTASLAGASWVVEYRIVDNRAVS